MALQVSRVDVWAGQIKDAPGALAKKLAKLAAVRVVGADRPGLGAKITAALGEAGINIRSLSGSVIGKKFMVYLTLDKAADATKAARIVRKV